MAINTLSEFYACMKVLSEIRARIVEAIKNADTVEMSDIKALEQIKLNLEDIPRNGELYELKTNQDKSILIELDYELSELKKDDIFLKHGPKELKDYMSNIHPHYEDEVKKGLNFINQHSYQHFITDRDGTISNYCGRYQSSIQPIYNALCLSEFSNSIEGNSIILTSAPLLNNGLADVSVQPEGEYILAGSKGREFLLNGKKHSFPIEEHQELKLKELNTNLEKLLENEEYSLFRYIGSGLQYKFGQTTIARQDKNNSISEKKSIQFKNSVEGLIADIDPEGTVFSLEDTGKDLEIMLNVTSTEENTKEFDKGDGLNFVLSHLEVDIADQNILICGDTFSDIPLITAAQDSGAHVSSVFVTEDQNLKDEVRARCKDSFFVSSPDVLIYILYKYSKNQASWNPVSLFLSLIN